MQAPQGIETSLGSTAGSNRRGQVFTLLLWGLVATLYFTSPFLLVVLGWFQEPFSDLGGGDRVSHRVHEILFGVTFAQVMAGAISQLLRPRQWSAGMLQTLIAIAAFVLVLAAVGRREWLGVLFLSLAGAAAWLHPAGRELWRGRWRPSPFLLVLAVAGVMPWVSVAEANLLKAQLEAADHLTHWGGVATFAVVQLLLAFLAAMRPPGFRLVAASVGAAGLIYFAASQLFPFDASAEPLTFSPWLLLWSLAWMAIPFLPEEKRRRVGWPRLVRGGLAGLGLMILILGGTIAGADEESNIPHGLSVDYTAADRLTCLECHATALKGATVIPHELGRICEGDVCWDGRSDCMGCHRYDPSLIAAASLPVMETTTGVRQGGIGLLADQVLALRRYGR
ncbi:MAG: hypothetical protein WD651_15965 [Acidimicrobiia bacterium]